MPDELFSERQGRPRTLSQEDFADLIWKTINAFRSQGYFDEALTHHPGPTGDNLPPQIPNADAVFLRELKRADIYRNVAPSRRVQVFATRTPVSCQLVPDVLWDTLEFLYARVVSKKLIHPAPTDENAEAGADYIQSVGRDEFRRAINPDLGLHDPPMEMLRDGQIVEKAPDELRPLLDDPIPDDTPAVVRDPLHGAIEQYRRRGATDHDKRSALKYLADVLEPMREEVDEYLLPADEKALFTLANKFWIRHNNREQMRNYDGSVWLDWMFYVYIATARALLAVVDRQRLTESLHREQPDDNDSLSF